MPDAPGEPTAIQAKNKRRRNIAIRKTAVSHMQSERTKMLLPIFITVGLSVIANVGTGIWQGATFKAQVARQGEHQIEQDATAREQGDALRALYTRLPIDYVPRNQMVQTMQQAMEQTKEMREVETHRMDMMEVKLDTIIENQHRK